MFRPLALICAAGSASAAPEVVTDIAPIHSLVSMVTNGVSTPALLVRPGASPHSYALRPSEARALAGADVVFWVGDALSPWLEEPIETLAPGALSIELLHLPGTTILDARGEHHHHDDEHDDDHEHEESHTEGHAHEEGHDHDEHAEHDDHDHDKDHDAHADHDHEVEADQNDHDEHDAHEGHDDHDHAGGKDPHAWLDPHNAQLWLGEIAEVLAAQDPENAATYHANAAAASEHLASLDAELTAQFAELDHRHYAAVHDAFQYLEKHFDLEFEGAITDTDAADPSAGHLVELAGDAGEHGHLCVLSEPGSNPTLITNTFGEMGVRITEIDPLGTSIAPGPDMYPALIAGAAGAIRACLQD